MSKLSFFYFTESSSLARLGAAFFFLCQSHAFALGAPQTTTSPALVFVDLASHTAAVPAINSMVAQGIMRGVSQTQFAPDAYYSMGEFAVSMQHMFNLAAPCTADQFHRRSSRQPDLRRSGSDSSLFREGPTVSRLRGR
jgi:hypothetical protein